MNILVSEKVQGNNGNTACCPLCKKIILLPSAQANFCI